MKLKILFLFASSWLCYIQPGKAQLNLVSGYTGGYYQTEQYNDIIDRYNASLDSVRQSFNGINVLNGASVGLNYRINSISLELLWTERFKINRQQTINITTGNESGTSSLLDRYRSISLGLNVHVNKLVIGSSVNYDQFVQRLREPQADRQTITDENNWSVNLHIGFFGKANRTSAFSIRPYVHLPLSNINIASLDRRLNESNATNIEEDFTHFGLSILFYNGPQRNE
ncbi:MAG: hypothetical protein AAF849_10085 [Bacteroidota bacterium]